jgi:hypothetical protein
MKHILYLFLLVALSGSAAKYPAYRFDNGDDYVQEGLYRIVDPQGKIGYATKKGQVVIKPQFAFGFPFEKGEAKVTKTGKSMCVDSGCEHSYWESDDWFYIDKKGNRIR